MKPLLFVCLYICCGLLTKGQGEYAWTDSKALSIPASETYSSDSIAYFVRSNFKSEREKVRAIYTWVISNIRYDTDSMFPINWSMEHADKISATLRRRKGVCENYASLFSDIASKAGFPSFVVSGHTRQQGVVNRSGHSWSAVYLEQEWFLCDPTWDVGYRGNTRYFLVSPGEFIESHIPFDPMWQLLEYPVMEHQFGKGERTRNRLPLNYKDSVKAFLLLDSLQQLESATMRIRQAGIENERQKNWLAYNQMKIAGIYGEKDMNLYNAAVADLNKANVVFNDFVHYRNNLFTPVRADTEMRLLLDPIDALVSSALKKLEQVGRAVENFQYDTGTIRDRLSTLKGRVQEQQLFLKRYLETDTAQRQRLFYK